MCNCQQMLCQAVNTSCSHEMMLSIAGIRLNAE